MATDAPPAQTIHLSLNAEVSVILTKAGADLLEEYYASDPVEGKMLRLIHRVSSEGSRFAIWEIFRIFGPKMFLGAIPLFVNDTIATLTEDPIAFTPEARVDVRLTPEGDEALKTYHGKLYPTEGVFPYALFRSLHHGNGCNTLWFPLGELAHIFGPMLTPEGPYPFVDRDLLISLKNTVTHPY